MVLVERVTGVASRFPLPASRPASPGTNDPPHRFGLSQCDCSWRELAAGSGKRAAGSGQREAGSGKRSQNLTLNPNDGSRGRPPSGDRVRRGQSLDGSYCSSAESEPRVAVQRVDHFEVELPAARRRRRVGEAHVQAREEWKTRRVEVGDPACVDGPDIQSAAVLSGHEASGRTVRSAPSASAEATRRPTGRVSGKPEAALNVDPRRMRGRMRHVDTTLSEWRRS